MHGAEHRDTDIDEMDAGRLLRDLRAVLHQRWRRHRPSVPTRVTEGLIRAYLVLDSVVGFSRQTADTLITDAVSAARVMGLPSPKTMYPPDSPELARLRMHSKPSGCPAYQEHSTCPENDSP